MATYQYKARDKFGKMIQGMMAGDSENAVAAKLRQTEYTPISISQSKEGASFKNFFDQFQKVAFADLNMFTRQLFTLQKAGLPILSSLMALKEQITNVVFKEIIEQVIRDIEGGSNFSNALSKHPRVFNALYVNMITSGEISGRLAETLERLADLGEHEEGIRKRIEAAMRYPLIVVTAITIAFLILVTFVVPRFSKLYSQFKTALPLPTRILIGIHYTITHFWWLLILIVIVLIYLFRRFVATEKGRVWWDTLTLRVPIFGPLMVKLIMSRFSRITGTLLRSGVSILQILDLVSQSVGNVVISKTIDHIKVSVNEGKGMLEPMKNSGMFPVIVTQMVSVGENTGKLDELLLHVSDYYDGQIDHTIKNLVSLIEPILVMVLGFVVLFMALGIFLPMWSLMNLFKQ